MRWFAIVALLLHVTLLNVQGVSSQNAEQTVDSATFIVSWYDVGKAALAGQPGIVSVENGWLDGKEVNQVTYNPKRITVKQIEKLLKRSGTYRSSVDRPK